MMNPLMNEMINVNAHEMQCNQGIQTPRVLHGPPKNLALAHKNHRHGPTDPFPWVGPPCYMGLLTVVNNHHEPST
jgi:hypothetical protein